MYEICPKRAVSVAAMEHAGSVSVSRTGCFSGGSQCSTVRADLSWQTVSCGEFSSASEFRGPAGSQQKNACHQISRAVGRHTSCRHHNQLLRVNVHPVRKTDSGNHRANAAFVTGTSRELYHCLIQSIYPDRGFLMDCQNPGWLENGRNFARERWRKLAFTCFRPAPRLPGRCGPAVGSHSRLRRPSSETLSESCHACLPLYSVDSCRSDPGIFHRMRKSAAQSETTSTVASEPALTAHGFGQFSVLFRSAPAAHRAPDKPLGRWTE